MFGFHAGSAWGTKRRIAGRATRHFPQLAGFRRLAIMFALVGHSFEYRGLSPVFADIGRELAAAGAFLFFA